MSNKREIAKIAREIRELKKQAAGGDWVEQLWDYAGKGRAGYSPEGEEIADLISHSVLDVEDAFALLLKLHRINVKMHRDGLDDGNATNVKMALGGGSDSSGDIAWGFFSNNLKPYVMFEFFEPRVSFYKHGPAYNPQEDPEKSILKGEKWLHNAISELDELLSDSDMP